MAKKTESQNVRLLALLGMVVFAILARLAAPAFFPQHVNFAPIGAMALFGGVYFRGRIRALFVTLLAVFAGDILLNYAIYFHKVVLFYDGWYWQYLSYAAIVFIGGLLQNRVKPLTVISASVASSLAFFLISNFGVWAQGLYYPFTVAGLGECYAMGLPFIRETLLSDLFYSAVLFGVFEFAQRKFPALSANRLQPAKI